MVPGHIGEIGFDKKYFSKEIKNIERKYRDAVTKDHYMKTYHNKVLSRLSKLSRDRKITEFYIFDEPTHNFADNVILDNFPAFRNSYSKGTFGHTNDAKFSSDLCELISPYLA